MSRSRRGRHEFRPPQPARTGPRAPVWNRKLCDACRQSVILAEEDTGGGRLRGALLEADPVLRGPLVRTIDGVLVRDPGQGLPGIRYAWHHCPVRNG